MRKVFFFFGLLATVAVGQAVAKNATANARVINAYVYNPNGPCEEPVVEEVPCNPISGAPCTIAGTTYAQLDSELGTCTLPLFRD